MTIFVFVFSNIKIYLEDLFNMARERYDENNYFIYYQKKGVS